MQPNRELITIGDNLEKIKGLLTDLVLTPRLNAIKWSSITKQTPNIKVGYPGQHLASLVTGMEGERTGARGNDLVDGSEVKSCSRIDQLDKCSKCMAAVARLESMCPKCGSSEIERKNDSKWLFTIRSEEELDLLIHRVDRVVLMLADYPNFDRGDYATLRFQCFEIWPKSARNGRFAQIITNYYHKIYLAHKAKNPNKTPAPKNFWPYSYQFYLCNPIQIFSCTVRNSNSKAEIVLEQYLSPEQDRSSAPSLMMPVELMSEEELDVILTSAPRAEVEKVLKEGVSFGAGGMEELLVGIDETLRGYLSLRETDRISVAKRKYERGVRRV